MSPSAERDPRKSLEILRRDAAKPPIARYFRGSRLRGAATLAAVILIILIGGAAALAPWLFSHSALLDAIATQLQTSSGLYVAAGGRARLAFAPQPHISIDGVAFADRNGALVIKADQMHGVLNLLPLAAGRLEVSALALVRPRATIDLDEKPIYAPGVAAHAAAARAATPEAQRTDKARLGVVAIVDGALQVKRGGREHRIEKINMTLDWRRVGLAATLSGDLFWRGEKLETTLWVAQPAALLRGEQSVATASFSGAGLRLDAQGQLQSGANARFSGRFSGATESVREALARFGASVPLPGPFSSIQFSTQATLGLRDAQFQDIRFIVDGNEFEGAASLRYDESRPRLSATLKSAFFSTKPILADIPPLTTPDNQWSREDFAPPDLAGADVDVSLHAAHARLGALTVDDAEFALTLREGALDLVLADARAYRGKVRARAEILPSGRGLSVRATARTSGVEAGALLWDALGRQTLAGALDASLALDAAGANMAELMRTLSGRVSLSLRDGEIDGVNLDRALRRLEKRPLASAQDIRSGHSTLNAAVAAISIDNGSGAIEEGAARGPGFSLAYSGTVNFMERSLAMRAVAREADGAGAPRDNGQQITLDLGGGWDELTLTPDAQAFIRRSDAAAPLLPRADAPPPDPPSAP